MSRMQEETVLPPQDAEALTAVEAILVRHDDSLSLVAADGSEVGLPEELRAVLTRIVTSMRRGQAITLAPHALRLTTQQAADLLGVSRPTLVKLLVDGKIPYETPNRHRRIRLIDLLNFQSTRRSERRQTVQDLSREAQELGMYDRPPEDYEAALAEARHKLA
jgi:excisionase family DNA binding protein